MQLPKAIQQRLAKEFSFAAAKMSEAPDLSRKLYFFSVFFGEANRAMNQSWRAELALLDMVAQATYMTIQAQMMAPVPVELPRRLPDELTIAAQGLASLFEEPEINSDNLCTLLARIAELSYVSTGNGRFLFLKGDIKV